ncbi:MAG: hypothetical protein H6669_04775 [Ardenticatenaceae bacterium]|nr:hypothetical protein [Ardenticatenaceae bacterium]
MAQDGLAFNSLTAAETLHFTAHLRGLSRLMPAVSADRLIELWCWVSCAAASRLNCPVGRDLPLHRRRRWPWFTLISSWMSRPITQDPRRRQWCADFASTLTGRRHDDHLHHPRRHRG